MQAQMHAIAAGVLLAAFILGGFKVGFAIFKYKQCSLFERAIGILVMVIFFMLGALVVGTV
jgi:hypothetical protein